MILIDSFFVKKRKQKAASSLFLGSIFFTLVPISCFSLPDNPEVISGRAEVKASLQEMHIHTSDRAILHYKDFVINQDEKVVFVQPSSSSCVLNKVKGENPSQILGKLQSNGKVFLVNPNGIYFGPSAQVNVGSLIASTLDIENEDFLNDKYRFTLKNSSGFIQNEGSLISSPEGSIVLMAPHIQNQGFISAKAGHVLLAAGKEVTLDFTGDGLVQFSVEGALKEALLESQGKIEADGGLVSLHLGHAKKVIQEIVNLDGVEEGDLFLEENGVIRLVSGSSFLAQKGAINGSSLTLEGKIDVSSKEGKGGELRITGKDIWLTGAEIDASGLLGGGEVLIGGEFQGKGITPHASKVIMDPASSIFVDALEKGDGGTVVLWSHDHTVFNGTISARGGSLGGDGGLIETSSHGILGSMAKSIDLRAPLGENGTWLLDPSILELKYVNPEIGPYLPRYPGCFQECISCSNTEANLSCSNDNYVAVCSNFCSCGNITFSASEKIIVDNYYNDSSMALNLEESGNLTFSSCTGNLVPVYIGGEVRLYGHSVTFDNTFLVMTGNVAIDTTHGGHTGGGSITVPNIQSTSPNYTLFLKSGTSGVMSMSTASAATLLSGNTYPNSINLSTCQSVALTGDLVTSGGVLNLLAGGSLSYTGSGTTTVLDTTKNGTYSGSAISTGPINASTTRRNLSINAGSANVNIPSIGTDTNQPNTGNISIVAGSINPITLRAEGNVVITTPSSSNTMINSISTIGTIESSGLQGHFVSLVGGTFQVPSISAESGFISMPSATLSLSSDTNFTTVTTTGADILLGPVTEGGSLTLSAGHGTVTLNNSISGIGAFAINSASEVVTQAISAQSIFQLNSNAVSNYQGDLTATSGGIALAGTDVTVGNMSATGAIAVSVTSFFKVRADSSINGSSFTQSNFGTTNLLGSVFLTSPGDVFFGGPIAVQNLDSKQNVFYTATQGPFTVTNGGLLTIPLLYLTQAFTQNGTGALSIGGNLTASSLSLNNAIATTLTANSIWDTSGGGGNITAGTINSNSGSSFALTLSAGSGTISVGVLGGSNPLSIVNINGTNIFAAQDITANTSIAIQPEILLSGATTFTAPDITLLSSVTSSVLSNFSLVATTISLGSVSTSGGSFSVGAAPIVLNNVADIFTSGGAITLNSIDGFFDLVLNSSSGNIAISGDIGGINPLHNVSITGASPLGLLNVTTTEGGGDHY